MDIPDKAVEAAARALYPQLNELTVEIRAVVATVIAPAAPFIAAQEVFRIETQAPRLTYGQLEWLARRREELESK